MGLLEQRNPKATRRSVTWWGIGGGIAGSVFGLIAAYRTDMPRIACFFMVPWMTVSCAVVGAVMEWQLPEEE